MFYAGCERILSDLEKQPHDPYYIAGAQIDPHLADDPNQDLIRSFCTRALREQYTP